MALDPQLLDILVCPEDKGSLLYFEAEDVLYNPRLKRSYAVRDGIPIMLIDEATAVDDAEHERLSRWPSRAGDHAPTGESVIRSIDSTLGMFAAAAGLPEQLAAAAASAAGSTGLPAHDDIENVVVLGVGGSGIAGDVVTVVAGPFMPVPGRGAQGLRHPELHQRQVAGVRHLVLGQHRGDPRGRHRGGAGRRSPGVRQQRR